MCTERLKYSLIFNYLLYTLSPSSPSLSLSLSLSLSPLPQGGIPVVVCHESKVKLLFKQADSCKTLRIIIKIGGTGAITDEEKTLSKETGITIHTIDEVIVSKKC